MRKTAFTALALFTSTACLAAMFWQKITHLAAGSTQFIGVLSNGYIVGAGALSVQSEYYQVMRTDQHCYFGHPDLMGFIRRLSHWANSQGLSTMLTGDMGMLAGGRFDDDHASHQTGLDVDIFSRLPKTRWTQSQLLRPQTLDLVSQDGKRVVPPLRRPEIFNLIRLAVKDNGVMCIFVNPTTKQQLCLDTGAGRDWLRKVRPWFQYRAHVHVRLRYPVDSPEYEDQPLLPSGDGCGIKLQSWLEPPRPGTAGPEKKTPPPPSPPC